MLQLVIMIRRISGVHQLSNFVILFQHCTAVPPDFVEGCLALMPHLVDAPLLAAAYWYPRAVLQLVATNACWWTISMGVVLLALRCRTAQ